MLHRSRHSRVCLPAAVVASLVLVALRSTALSAACIGDCNADGMVTVDELLQSVNIALASTPATGCGAVDINRDGEVTINELLAAVNAALNGCPVNHAPDVPCFGIYQASPGFAIGVAIDAADADGDRLRYTATDLPDGAGLDEDTGVVSWTPTPQQFGTFYIPFAVTDDGAPPLSTDGLLTFKVSPQDRCQQIACDPAVGCERTPLPLSQPCCTDLLPRVAEPLAPCPQGRVLFVGRNRAAGIGRLQDCDALPVVNSAQTSASVRLNIETRCVNADQPVTVRARLQTLTRLVFDQGVPVVLNPGADGYLQRTALVFPVQTPGPFFDLDEADATLTVTLTDIDGVSITTRLRPTLTFRRPGDLTDLNAAAPSPGATDCP